MNGNEISPQIMTIEILQYIQSTGASKDGRPCTRLKETGDVTTFSEVEEKQLVSKTDRMIVPLVWAIYFLQYQDKILMMCLLDDTGMRTDQFSNLALAFYVSIFLELPTGYLMQRLATAKYLGLNGKNFAGLVVLRVLLGCFETAVTGHASLILTTSMWYRRDGTGTATIVGALVAYGLLFYTADKFYSWQIMFLIFGLVTIAVGVTVIAIFLDNSMTSRLNHEENIIVIERLRANRIGIENKQFKWAQSVEVFSDRQAVVSILAGTHLAARFDQRCLCVIGILSCGPRGGCLMAFAPSDNKGAKLAGNSLKNCVGSALPLMYSIAGANVAGHTKKVTMNAIVLMSFCLGNILGPLSFRTQDEPQYMPAKVAIVATVSVAILFTVLLKCYYMYENRRRERNGLGAQHQENSEFLNLTDRENLDFRVIRLFA
ncbi:putative MFS transporter [Aspergillus homomorphus CBS 101889]|uniref:MFS general substrate transporter n=1 Tax=Aspergillus homomorphus (strain CBS 101889) TaxID=1450537 RepID=A0A395HU39_ASPHC|nr:MFS general substrate transporter [Aspergillus homomorphus CBS 101889]RAL11327.1 MFS general substrate transporter [Aspergillus homomorphus CBS 101889]